jgi:pyruvate carboxylase
LAIAARRTGSRQTKADEIGEPRASGARLPRSRRDLFKLARRVGADAIHPGYGFLSEDPELASACEPEEITFVRPPPHVFAIAANKLRARDAGLPVREQGARTAQEATCGRAGDAAHQRRDGGRRPRRAAADPGVS